MDTVQFVADSVNLAAESSGLSTLHLAVITAAGFGAIYLGMTKVGLLKGGRKASTGGKKGRKSGDSNEDMKNGRDDDGKGLK